jgi:hypothetical protein
MIPTLEIDPVSWTLARRPDGAVLVRVPSAPSPALPLPDAVFAFRAGDPQFDRWEQILREREQIAGGTIEIVAAAAD